jgi:hypothetical protein
MVRRNAVPLSVQNEDLSLAWGEVLLKLLTPGVNAIAPLTVSITSFAEGGNPIESPSIRTALEDVFKAHNIEPDIEAVAFTIFPEEYWELANSDRSEFFELFRDSFPRMQDWNSRHNFRGSYFQRLVDYEGENRGPDQLDWIISEFLRRPQQRVSQFQATTFDPRRDLSRSAQVEFPCLQHVSFVPLDDCLVMNACYATQQVLRKGYGNYLGLSRLGAFMAAQMGLCFDRLNIFVGVAKMDAIGKTDPALQALASEVRLGLGQCHEPSQQPVKSLHE